jgi:hypothetical protein
LQTGTGGASLAVTRFLEDKMRRNNITASFGLGGITGTMVDLHEKGLIKALLDTQSLTATPRVRWPITLTILKFPLISTPIPARKASPANA